MRAKFQIRPYGAPSSEDFKFLNKGFEVDGIFFFKDKYQKFPVLGPFFGLNIEIFKK